MNHRWTDEERDIVRRDYDGHNKTAERIAGKLGVTFTAIKGQAGRMGILRDKSPDWTDRDLELLSKWIHQYSTIAIAHKLHRSVNAVKIKATRLKMGIRFRDGWYTKKEVAEICGESHKKVQSWIDSGILKAKWHTDRKPQQGGMAMWHILESDLRHFIIKYNGELIGRNVDLFAIVSILAGDGIDRA